MFFGSVLLATMMIAPLHYPFQDDGGITQDTIGVTKVTRHSFDYHRFLLLRHEGRVIAIFAMPNPRYGNAGITYQWFSVSAKVKSFEHQTGWENENPEAKFGIGSTRDGLTCRNSFPAYIFGLVEADNIKLKWSSNNKDSGVLSFSEEQSSIEVYPEQFDRLDDVFDRIDPKKWRSLNTGVENQNAPNNTMRAKPPKACVLTF